MTQFSPAQDPLIAKPFSIGSLERKVQNKTLLQESLGWPNESRRPLLCLPAGMTEELGGSLLREVLPGILSMQVEILVLGKGSTSYGSLFTKLAKEESHRIHIVPQDEKSMHQMYAASDMALFLSDDSLDEIDTCLEYGVVPIAMRMPALEDYDPIQERGNAFLFDAPNQWLCFAAVVRAVETYKFPFDWRTIQKHCMESGDGA